MVRGTRAIPDGLAAAIHARFGAGAIRSSSAAQSTDGPNFGFSIALSADGTTALVGAPGAHHDNGAAYIFRVSDAGSWSSSATPTATLTDTPGPATDQGYFGFKVALSADGTTAFAVAPEAGAYGAIYVFHVSAEDAWTSSSTPTATLKVKEYLFAFALAVSADGTTVVGGAPFHEDFDSAGVGYIFHASSEGAWVSKSFPTATLSNAGESGNDSEVGYFVAISGDGTTALLSDSNNPSGGGAYIYHVSAENAWTSTSTPTAILSDAGGVPGDGLGHSVALSGDGTVALLGAPGAGSGTGAADVFHVSDAGSWASTSTPTATLTNAAGGSAHGQSVALAPDGMTALVTAPRAHLTEGAAYIFHVAGEGAWASSSAPTATLHNSGGRINDFLGDGAVFSGDGATVLVGASRVRYETGAADLFHVSDASSWASSATPSAILTNSRLNRCVVPRLKGLTVRAAKAALKERSCSLGRVHRVVHAGGRRGHVFSQSAKPGVRLAVGAKIAVKVKSDRPR